jgi:heptosyltransferase-2
VNKERILVVGPSWVGDMIMAQSLFKQLKRTDAKCEIDVVAPSWSLPVIERMPEVRQGVAVDVGHGEFGLGKRRELARQLRAKQYDRAIVLPRSFKSALIPWFTNIPKRTGFRGEMRFGLINDMRALDKRVLDQTAKKFVALGLADGAPVKDLQYPELNISLENQQAVMQRMNLGQDKPVVAMMPGAEYGPAKCWPLASFAKLSNSLINAGYTVWVLGSANDDPAGQFLAENGGARNLCGKTTLADAIDLLAYCEHAVTNDSGLMHVAAAVGTYVHAIYGSSSPDYTPPLTDRASIHYKRLDCSPCFERECPLAHLNCLNSISADDVMAGFDRVN